ncbi:cysteine peptidase family C39 domain-containing protein [Lactiplantibacillus plantarum]|uniref:cysteine peptidase family C39 domain-containing protein n=1 Tax=Lactiplantibacillus plantarum TaxID=1590 RepID=UPI003D6B0406
MVCLCGLKNGTKYYTAQVDENDCGLAALIYDPKNTMALITCWPIFDSLPKTTADGTTVLGLVKAAKSLKF